MPSSTEGYSEDDFASASGSSANTSRSASPIKKKEEEKSAAAATTTAAAESQETEAATSETSPADQRRKSSTTSAEFTAAPESQTAEGGEGDPPAINGDSGNADESGETQNPPDSKENDANDSRPSTGASNKAQPPNADDALADDKQQEAAAVGDADTKKEDAKIDDPTIDGDRNAGHAEDASDYDDGGFESDVSKRSVDATKEKEVKEARVTAPTAAADNDAPKDSGKRGDTAAAAEEKEEAPSQSAVPAARGGVGRRGLLPATTSNKKGSNAKGADVKRKASPPASGKMDIYDFNNNHFAPNSELKISATAQQFLTNRLYQPEILKARTERDFEERRNASKLYNYSSTDDKFLKAYWKKKREAEEAARRRREGGGGGDTASDDDDHHSHANANHRGADGAAKGHRSDSLTLSFASSTDNKGGGNETDPNLRGKGGGNSNKHDANNNNHSAIHANSYVNKYKSPYGTGPAYRPKPMPKRVVPNGSHRRHQFGFEQQVSYSPAPSPAANNNSKLSDAESNVSDDRDDADDTDGNEKKKGGGESPTVIRRKHINKYGGVNTSSSAIVDDSGYGSDPNTTTKSGGAVHLADLSTIERQEYMREKKEQQLHQAIAKRGAPAEVVVYAVNTKSAATAERYIKSEEEERREAEEKKSSRPMTPPRGVAHNGPVKNKASPSPTLANNNKSATRDSSNSRPQSRRSNRSNSSASSRRRRSSSAASSRSRRSSNRSRSVSSHSRRSSNSRASAYSDSFGSSSSSSSNRSRSTTASSRKKAREGKAKRKAVEEKKRKEDAKRGKGRGSSTGGRKSNTSRSSASAASSSSFDASSSAASSSFASSSRNSSAPRSRPTSSAHKGDNSRYLREKGNKGDEGKQHHEATGPHSNTNKDNSRRNSTSAAQKDAAGEKEGPPLPPPVTTIRRKDLTALWLLTAPPPEMIAIRSMSIAAPDQTGIDLTWMTAKHRTVKKIKEELPSPHRYGRDKYRLDNQLDDTDDDDEDYYYDDEEGYDDYEEEHEEEEEGESEGDEEGEEDPHAPTKQASASNQKKAEGEKKHVIMVDADAPPPPADAPLSNKSPAAASSPPPPSTHHNNGASQQTANKDTTNKKKPMSASEQKIARIDDANRCILCPIQSSSTTEGSASDAKKKNSRDYFTATNNFSLSYSSMLKAKKDQKPPSTAEVAAARQAMVNTYTADVLMGLMRRRTVAAESLDRMKTRRIGGEGGVGRASSLTNDNKLRASRNGSISPARGGSGSSPVSTRAWIGSTNSKSMSMAGGGPHQMELEEERKARLRERRRRAREEQRRRQEEEEEGHHEHENEHEDGEGAAGKSPSKNNANHSQKKQHASSTSRHLPPVPQELVTLKSIPMDIPDNEGSDPHAISSLSTLLINSPRSGIVLLRNGVTLKELLPTPLYACMMEGAREHAMPVAMEKRFLARESRRRKLLSKLNEDYAVICANISLQGTLKAFVEANPSDKGTTAISFAADDAEIKEEKEAKKNKKVQGDNNSRVSSAHQYSSANRQIGSAATDRPGTNVSVTSRGTNGTAATSSSTVHPQSLPIDQSAVLMLNQRLERYAVKKRKAARQQHINLLLVQEHCDRVKSAAEQQRAYEARRAEELKRQAEERQRRREERAAKLEQKRKDAEALDALSRDMIQSKLEKEVEIFEQRRAERARQRAIEKEAVKTAIRERLERVAQAERSRQFERLCAADKARRKADKVAAAKALSHDLHKQLRDERDAMRREEIETQHRIAADVLAFRRSNDI